MFASSFVDWVTPRFINHIYSYIQYLNKCVIFAVFYALLENYCLNMLDCAKTIKYLEK